MRRRNGMRCGSFPANAGSFSIGLLTCNLHYNQCLGFRSHALGNGWERSQVQVVHRRLLQTVGKIVHDGGQMFLKTSAAMLDTFVAIRERCARVTREGGAIPETSRSRLRQLRRKHSNPPAPNAETVTGTLGECPALPPDEKWPENSRQPTALASSKIPSRNFGPQNAFAQSLFSHTIPLEVQHFRVALR
jgi:hypothetical protein